MTPNQAAFLAMLSHSEGTDRAADPYRCCYGFRHTIEDMSDHPAITGEWLGESLASLGAQYAHEVSTAAGKYQLIKPTWITCKARAELPDFTPASQDDAALVLIAERGALADIEAGRLYCAVALCSPVWASLPGSTSGQPQRSMVALSVAFTDAGGLLS